MLRSAVSAPEWAIKEFDVELYFALVEKMTVFDGGRVIVVLLDGTEIECEI